MYGQSAVIYLWAAVFSACTIAGDSDVALKLREVACNLCSPNELQSCGTGAFPPRRDSRFGGMRYESVVPALVGQAPSGMMTVEQDHHAETDFPCHTIFRNQRKRVQVLPWKCDPLKSQSSPVCLV